MSPFLAKVLIWGGFALFCTLAFGFWIFAFVSESIANTRPQDLKTFAAMKKAFRRGSKTNIFDHRRSSAIIAMRELADGNENPAQREEIAAIMRDAISESLHATDNHAANDVRRMLETLEAAAPPWEADFLEKVSRSSLEGWVRGNAIQRLVRLRGHGSIALLLAVADDPPVADAVAAAIAGLGPRAATPEVLARLQRMLGETQNVWAPSAAVRALIAIGHATNPVLMDHLDKFDPWTRFAVRLKAAGIDAAALIERLFVAGMLDDDRRKRIKPSTVKKMQKDLNTGDGFKAVTAFLERVRAVHNFDTEWDPVPDYEMLLRQLASIGEPRVTIADIDVQLDGEACREVNCKVAGQPARFSPEFMDDWTDLAAVLTGLNSALEAGGRPERFVSLLTGDQNACVIVGHEAGIAGLVETLGLPVDANANAAIAIGIAAEGHTAEQLKAEGYRVVRG